ncbi:hypothetical protein GCM10027592_62240 [Spirosoma flavus]|jgi:5'(3')-deoxyribonucleotidase|uniref:hypothetical protein n=1 Tax=Spirosoma TaxID=107 RepID=UPI0003680650|nr:MULTISPECIES: hypothetical protein [Spirosoma]OJW75442.1 MAG: hypothetical protein BGO59_04350 [Spirosoma sp. 48-14]
MKDSDKSDSKKLSDLIKESNITMQDLAEVLNYNRATIRVRKKNPELYTILEIVTLAKMLKKTPTAVVKIILREMNESAGDVDKEDD